MNDADSSPLMAAAIAGDHEALTTLLGDAAPAVRAQIQGLLPQRWQALLALDDVMQQTYTDAFLAVGRFRPSGPDAFQAWLVTLARRNLLDAVRMLEADKRGGGRVAVAGHNSTSLDLLYDQVAASQTTPSRRLAREEIHSALQAAVAQLPPEHRQVIEAIDLQGQDVAGVAEAMRRSTGSVYMLRSRGHRWLGELLNAGSDFFSQSA